MKQLTVAYYAEVRFDPAGGYFRKWAWRVVAVYDGRRRELAWAFPSKAEGRTFTRRSAVERAGGLTAVLEDERRKPEGCFAWEVVA